VGGCRRATEDFAVARQVNAVTRVNRPLCRASIDLLTRVTEGAVRLDARQQNLPSRVCSLLSQCLIIRRIFFIQPPKNSPSRETGSGDIRQ
ncbi:hypothetical protein KI387_018000, partial [Taxus chinensis]